MVDRRLSANQITDDICISRVSVENTLHKEICMPKVSFKWAPGLQASNQKRKRLPKSREKSHIDSDPAGFFDVYCIHHFESDTKRPSM